MWGCACCLWGSVPGSAAPRDSDTCQASWLVPCSPIPAAGVGGRLPILSKGEVVTSAVDISHRLFPLFPGTGDSYVPWQLQRERAFD